MSSEEDEESMQEETGSEDEDQSEHLRRKIKNEALVTSGLGKNKEKVRIVDAFWSVMWPALERLGWTKEDGTGEDEGLIFFKTPDEEEGEELDHIKAVIDRVLARQTSAEAKIADSYQEYLEGKTPEEEAKQADEEGPDASAKPALNRGPKAAVLPISRGSRKHSPPRDPPKPIKKSSPAMRDDSSWKEGGRTFPRRASSIGSRFQVSVIPDAGTFDEAKPESEQYFTLIWDPKRAEEKGIDPELFQTISSSIKEAALIKLAELDYDKEALQVSIDSIKPTDGSDWGQERKEIFRDEIFKNRKDFRAVCKATQISMKTCLAYYLGTFKSTDDYRVLKTVCSDEYAMRMEAHEHAFDACAICSDGGSLIICDGCEGEYHMECCRPALQRVPEGLWLCDECVDRKFLAARQYIIQKSQLFEKHQDKKRSFEDMKDTVLPAGVEKVVYRPTEPVLKAVRKFAKGLSEVLSTGKVVERMDDQ